MRAGFEDYCVEEFQEKNGITPNFYESECFRRTILVWLPSLFLLVFAPFEIFFANKSKNERLPITKLHRMKRDVAFALAIIATSQLVVSTVNSQQPGAPLLQFVSPLLLSAAMFGIFGLLLMCQSYGLPTSGVIWLSLLVFTACGAIDFAANILKIAHKAVDPSNAFDVISSVIFYPLVVLQLILTSFADSRGQNAGAPSNVNPKLYASFLSKLAYWWLTPLMLRGRKTPLTREALPPLCPGDQSAKVHANFSKYWSAAMRKYQLSQRRPEDEPSILWCLFKCYKTRLIPIVILVIFGEAQRFIQPQVLHLLIRFVEDPLEPSWHGYVYAVLIFGVACVYSVILNKYYYVTARLGMNVGSILQIEIYRKALRLSNAATKQHDVGHVMNYMSVDVQRFVDSAPFIDCIFSCPVNIALSMFFLWRLLGPSSLVGLAVVLLLVPINALISRQQEVSQSKQLICKDARMALTAEVLTGVKVVKLSAWEPVFQKKLIEKRKSELQNLRWSSILLAAMVLTTAAAPFLASVLTFTTYVLADPVNHRLTAEVAFVSLSLFNLLRFPLKYLPSAINQIVMVRTSNKRLKHFLCSTELNFTSTTRKPIGDSVVEIRNGCFKWNDDDNNQTLQEINLRVSKGQLVAVVGEIRAGKSSLLSAILSEMARTETTDSIVNVCGSIAYVPQNAWIQNATLRENITFDAAMERGRYESVLDACELFADLQQMPDGDLTIGTNLSGGQKQRIGLARAVFAARDVYLLDDSLSAVDADVGNRIFRNVIGKDGLLKDKTRIFVTHGLQYLHGVDEVVDVANGKIAFAGSYDEFLRSGSRWVDHLQTPTETLAHRAVRDSRLHPPTIFDEDATCADVEDVPLLSGPDEEQRAAVAAKEGEQTRSVKLSVYVAYAKSLGLRFAICILLLYASSSAFGLGTNFWLVQWSEDSLNNSTSVEFRLTVFAMLGILQALFLFLASVLLTYSTMRASKQLHRRMLESVLNSALHFFDGRSGQILNRCGRDTETLDIMIPISIRECLLSMLDGLSTLITISVSTPWFIAVFLPLAFVYFFVQRFYLFTSRQLKRIIATSRSPIYSHFKESIEGATSIRAYDATERFIAKAETLVDESQSAYFLGFIADRWLGIHLEFIGNVLFVFSAAIIAVIQRDYVSAGLVAMSMAYAFSIAETLNFAVKTSSEIETNIVAVERIKEYIEAPSEENGAAEPSERWKPKRGSVHMVDLTISHGKSTKNALSDINFHAKSGEKIGIVGRTGAGKSTFGMAFFRILEPKAGRILIDGVDISTIELHDLRSALSIIPQDPVLFAGDLRLNVDPAHELHDDELLEAVKNAGLSLGLDHKIDEGGRNLSCGERQLVCLARALARNVKILVLDEATASVDAATDDMVQCSIGEHFRHCTVFVIAHRLNTIKTCDRIILLDKGKIVECGHPQELMSNTNSIFNKLARESALDLVADRSGWYVMSVESSMIF